MDKPTRKPRRILRFALVASLALNVAMIGALGGAAWKAQRNDGPPQRLMFDIGGIGRVLDNDDRRAIGEKIKRGGPRSVSRQQQRQMVQNLIEALRADPFDPAQVSAVFETMRERSANLRDRARDAFVDHLATMSVDERVEIANRLKRRRP